MKVWAPGDALPAEERPFYLDHRGEHLYVVRHAAGGARPRASVVLAGPMTLERSHGYLTWTRWARNLAANGFDVYRFDYRGVGESSGDFTQQTFANWQEDLEAVVAHARATSRGRVVVLGLRLGALLGRKVFDSHAADAFIAWDPPTGGTAMLMDMLRRKLAADYMEFGGERKTRDEYVRELEAGATIEVEGYPWTGGLWGSAKQYGFGEPERINGEWHVTWLDGRPAEKLPNRQYYSTARVPKPPFWLQSRHLVADLAELFELTIDRLSQWSDAWSVAETSDAVSQPPEPETKTGSRVLDVVDLPAGRCVGTKHVPAKTQNKIGLLWVNFGYVPRDGHGGLAAQASDVLAAQEGVPCFRYDLPGLGDAPGPLPSLTHDFFPVVTGGSFTEVTTQLVHRLCEREGLEGVVLAGLCGGAVNAIFTADAARPHVKGLLLLEPEMYVTEPANTDETPMHARDWIRARLPKDGRRWASVLDKVLATHLPFEEQLLKQVEKRVDFKKLRSKVFSYWGWMRLLTDENKYARYVPLPKKAILDFVLSRSELPSVTNVPLASAWQRWVKEKHPALIITADGKLREVFFDRINNIVLNGLDKQKYEHVRLKGTNHIFTTGGAIATVTGHVERAWAMFEPRVVRD